MGPAAVRHRGAAVVEGAGGRGWVCGGTGLFGGSLEKKVNFTSCLTWPWEFSPLKICSCSRFL